MKKIYKLLIITVSVLFFHTSIAQKSKMTPESLWGLGRVSAPTLSPDGKTVVYSVKRYLIKENSSQDTMYSVSSNSGTSTAIALPEDKAYGPVWHPSGNRIFFLSSKSGSSQIWCMDPDGKNKSQVSSEDNGVTNFGFTRDGNKLWFTKDVQSYSALGGINKGLDKTTARVYDDLMYRHWDQWEDNLRSHVFVVDFDNKKNKFAKLPYDIMSGEPYDSPLMPFGEADQIAWSPDGNQIAYTCKKVAGTQAAMSTNSDIYLFNLTTKKTTNLSEGMMGYDTKPAFSPDGKSITWLSMETPMFEADKNRIMLYDLASGNKNDLTGSFDYSVDAYLWSPEGKELFFLCGINATDQIWSVSTDPKAPSIKQITKEVADFGGIAVAKGPTLVATKMSISQPAEIFSINLKDGKPSQLTFANKSAMDTLSMGKVEKRMVKTTDGKEMLTWVIYPPDFDPKKTYPTLLYCQGGPQSTVSQFFSYRWNFQLMAAKGYIVVAPNRRGLPSFGTEWNRQISGDWGGQAMQDLLSAIDDISNEPYVDKNRRGAVGASFGGYSVYWLAGNHKGRFKSFISHCGVFNLESMYGTTEELFFADFEMGNPYFEDTKPRSYTDFNPINFVKNWDTPILIIHNDKDYRVPISQGMEAFTAARLKGVPARFLSFSDENHWVTKPQNGIMWQRVFFDWLGTYMK
jgi:dipeptidyl aminopeptidase/acylaminoacyl peptidase